MNRLSYVMERSPQILDTEAFAEINTPQDYNGPAYIRFTRSLNDLIGRENEWNSRIYCDIFKFKDGIRYSVCFLDGTIGAFFSPTDLGDSVIAESGEWVKMDYQNASGNYMSLNGPIYNADGSVCGEIEIGVDLSSLEGQIFTLWKKMMVSAALILALLLFVISEALASVSFMDTNFASDDNADAELPIPRLRPLTFVVFLAFNLPTGFLPNYAIKMGGSFLGFSPEISAALPIVANGCLLAVAPLISSYLATTLGRRISFAAGFLLCVAGYWASAVAVSIAQLVAGMGAVGLGAGILFTMIQICVSSRKNLNEKVLGFSSFASASFAGINCGIMTGGIIAASFDQKAVFTFGAFVWAFAMTAFLFLIRRNAGVWSSGGARATKPTASVRVFPRRVIAFLSLLVFPFTLYSGFMYYLVPVFASRMGFSDTEISLVFVLFAVGVMFLGPRIAEGAQGGSRQFSKLLGVALIMELTGILCFAYLPSTEVMLATVLIMGSACGIGYVYFPLFLTEIPEAKRLREGSDMALYNLTDNLGCAAGPMVFSAILHSGTSLWYYVLTASMLAAALIYHAGART
jgi:MFS family permease